jgi:RNA polymerase sigma factor (sigma-70 family)
MEMPAREECKGEAVNRQEGKGMRTDVLDHLRRLVAARDDGHLLDRYVATGDEAAFEALVRRHGPMVLGVCRRVLRDPNDAEDAFQATFLVLIRKAASVRPREMLPGWLHGVAYKTAVRARSAAVKRSRRERPVASLPQPQACQPVPPDDLRPLLDEELARLPGKYRAAIVLCELEGRTHKEAARELGWPEGTVASRLSRGRRLLAGRLRRRGVSLGTMPPPAGLSTSLVSSAVQGKAASAHVAALTKGVLNAMVLNKLKAGVAVLVVAGLVAVAGGWLTPARPQVAAGPPGPEQRPPSVQPVPALKVAAVQKQPPAKKRRLKVSADGKQVRVVADEVQGVADALTYDEEKGLLTLEGNVKVQRQRGPATDSVEGTKVIIDLRAGKVQVIGAGRLDLDGARLEGAMLGPTPIAVDFGFPMLKEADHSRCAFTFFMGFSR